nr:hypothetical protein [Candidatus Cloacimonadota bacterium]
MKYVYLARWVKDYRDFSASIEKIWLDGNTLHIALFKSGSLIVLLSPSDSFIYHDLQDVMPKEATELWADLRKSHIEGITIKEDDRIVTINLKNKDIYGEEKNYHLICELMPPKPNVILQKVDSGLVRDAIFKYSLADNPMRMVMVNQPYFPPKTSFTPDPEALPLDSSGKPISDINDYFAKRHLQILRPQDKKNDIEQKLKVLNKELKRLQKKLRLQKEDLENAEKVEFYHACAEAIKPNMHLIKSGQKSLTVTNYLDPELNEIKVPLQGDKSPHQNLSYYIKKYKKAKNGLAIIQVNIRRTEEEISALEKLIQRLSAGEDLDLDISKKSNGATQRINPANRILQYRYSDDWYIYIGRKAKENDFVTTKLGKPQDWWFHSRIYRGAHVLLRNLKKKNVPDELIEICCSLAAWYSQAKFSVNVPVDYTQIRYVRKPKGSPAGFVTYTNYKTAFANPKDLRSIKRDFEHD